MISHLSMAKIYSINPVNCFCCLMGFLLTVLGVNEYLTDCFGAQ